MKIDSKSKKINKAWLNDHVNDPYVKLAQREGFRARAALAWLSITHPGHDARRTFRFAVRPNAAPAAHRSAADIRLLCPRLGGSRPSAAMLRRCASAPAVLEGKARG